MRGKNFAARLEVFIGMKKAVVIVVTLMVISLAAAAQNVKIENKTDSVSYCLGYLSSRCLRHIDCDKMQSQPDIIEYIEGLRGSDLGKKTVITKKALYLWHTDLAGLFAEEKPSAADIPLSVPDMVDGLADGVWHRYRRMDLAGSEEFIACHPAESMKDETDTAVINLYSYALGMRASRELGLDGDAADYSAGVSFTPARGAKGASDVKGQTCVAASPRGLGRFIGDNMDLIAKRKGLTLSKNLFIEGAKAGLGLQPLLLPVTEPIEYIRNLYLLDADGRLR